MTRMHQWKGRMQARTQGYPFDNGPAFLVSGAPAVPNADAAGPYAGVDDSVVGDDITFTGPSTSALTVSVTVSYDSAGGVLWAGFKDTIASGQTATQIAAAVAAVLTAPSGLTATPSAGVVALSSAVGNVNSITVTYGPAA